MQYKPWSSSKTTKEIKNPCRTYMRLFFVDTRPSDFDCCQCWGCTCCLPVFSSFNSISFWKSNFLSNFRQMFDYISSCFRCTTWILRFIEIREGESNMYANKMHHWLNEKSTVWCTRVLWSYGRSGFGDYKRVMDAYIPSNEWKCFLTIFYLIVLAPASVPDL